MRYIIMLSALLAFASPAMAGWMCSVEDRASALRIQLEGNQSYEANLARKLANIAIEEKGQHDLDVARQFMDLAEQHAAKAGGK